MSRATLNHRQHSKHKDICFFILSLFIFFVVLSSCSCDFYLRKAKSKCGFTTTTDTIYRKDSVLIDRVTKDTLFKYFERDTVIVREGRLTMKYFYNTHDSTVYLSGKCDTVKIIKKVPVIINKTEIKQSYTVYLKWIALILALIAGIIFLLRGKS